MLADPGTTRRDSGRRFSAGSVTPGGAFLRVKGSVVSPGRPAAKNLLDLPTTGEVLRFLNALAYGPGSSETVPATRLAWRQLLPAKVGEHPAKPKEGAVGDEQGDRSAAPSS